MPYPEILQAYRANPKNKFGAKDYMETVPHKFDPRVIETFTRAAAAGTKYGVPVLEPKQLANMALHEGREDFGLNDNGIDYNNKKQVALSRQLQRDGHDEDAANFAAAIMGKHEIANRTNKPFLQLWNGSGKKAEQYARDSAAESYAAEHPKNQSFLEFIDEHYNDALPVEKMPFDPGPEPNFKYGGMVVKPLSGGQKTI
jgi:hypothetical protein